MNGVNQKPLPNFEMKSLLISDSRTRSLHQPCLKLLLQAVSQLHM
jgi:hypothetical protein